MSTTAAAAGSSRRDDEAVTIVTIEHGTEYSMAGTLENDGLVAAVTKKKHFVN